MISEHDHRCARSGLFHPTPLSLKRRAARLPGMLCAVLLFLAWARGMAEGGLDAPAVGPAAVDGADSVDAREKADELYRKKHFAEALRMYERLAADGDLFAVCRLGEMYLEGKGVQRSPRRAFQLYKQAAEAGAPVAECMLGVMYYEGIGVLRDYKAAAHWYEKAAKHGNGMAAFNLALMYLDGTGVPRDVQAYLQWLQKAAALENPRALFELANLYHDGRLLPKNLKKAIECYSKAAAAGEPAAQLALGLAFCTGDGVPRDLRRAKRFVKMAYDNPDADPGFQKKCEAVWNKYKLYDY